MNDPILDALNARINSYADSREWVDVTFVKVCRNCSSQQASEPQLMRRGADGILVKTSSPLPSGRTAIPINVPTSYSRCEKCGGSRPLRDAIAQAMEGSTNDKDLAQRLGRLLSDYVRRAGRTMG